MDDFHHYVSAAPFPPPFTPSVYYRASVWAAALPRIITIHQRIFSTRQCLHFSPLPLSDYHTLDRTEMPLTYIWRRRLWHQCVPKTLCVSQESIHKHTKPVLNQEIKPKRNWQISCQPSRFRLPATFISEMKVISNHCTTVCKLNLLKIQKQWSFWESRALKADRL